MAVDLSSELTVFVTTIGDDVNFKDCLDHLRRQTAVFPIEIIENLAPMSAAFQRMLDICRSPYYVQVDEDMLLHPNAIEDLYRTVLRSHKSVGIVCAPLWDCEIDSPIYGVKIYRHSVVRSFPYADKASCEMEQIDQMAAAGYRVLYIPLKQEKCIGEHGKHYSNKTIFNRWKLLFEKHRRTGHIAWIEPWPKRLLERYIRTRNELHLFAFLGAISGITCPILEDHSVDYRDASIEFTQLLKYLDSPLSAISATDAPE